MPHSGYFNVHISMTVASRDHTSVGVVYGPGCLQMFYMGNSSQCLISVEGQIFAQVP